MNERSSKLTVLLAAAVLASCGQPSNAPQLVLPEFESLKDVSAGPAFVQDAAKAVVKISDTSGASGTGSFVSPTGLLMTNNHVMGASRCLRDGCFVYITYNLQRGAKPERLELYAVPQRIVPELDVVFLQLKLSRDGENFDSPDYLELATAEQESDVGRTLYLVGHPAGYLKKWSVGQVNSKFESWVGASNFGLPGNSGSPMINEEGKVVAILHRGSGALGSIRKDGINQESFASIMASVEDVFDSSELQLVGEDRLSLFQGLDNVSEEVILANPDLFLNARMKSVTLPTVEDEAKTVNVEDLLVTACDKMNGENFKNYDEYRKTLNQCWAASQWVQCESTDAEKGEACPDDPSAWAKRAETIADVSKKFHNEGGSYYWLTAGQERLYSSRTEAREASETRLSKYLEKEQPSLSPRLAYYLSRYLLRSFDYEYQGQNLIAYLAAFDQQPGFENNLSWFLFAKTWAYQNKADLTAYMVRLANHPKASLEDRLMIEFEAFSYGFLD